MVLFFNKSLERLMTVEKSDFRMATEVEVVHDDIRNPSGLSVNSRAGNSEEHGGSRRNPPVS